MPRCDDWMCAMIDLRTWSDHDLLQAYRGYQKLNETGAVGEDDFDGLFRQLIDDQVNITPGSGSIAAASVLLREISSRWAADVAKKDAASGIWHGKELQDNVVE